MSITLDKEAAMAELIKRGKLNQAYKEVTALYGDAVDVEIHVIKLDTQQKQAQKPSKWQNFLKDAETVDISDDTLEHIQACSKKFREDFVFKHDLA